MAGGGRGAPASSVVRRRGPRARACREARRRRSEARGRGAPAASPATAGSASGSPRRAPTPLATSRRRSSTGCRESGSPRTTCGAGGASRRGCRDAATRTRRERAARSAWPETGTTASSASMRRMPKAAPRPAPARQKGPLPLSAGCHLPPHASSPTPSETRAMEPMDCHVSCWAAPTSEKGVWRPTGC